MKNSEVLERLDAVVSGHTEAKKHIINVIKRSKVRHYDKYLLNKHRDDIMEPAKLLLIGRSGTGKTYLVEEAVKIMGAPLVRIDATKLTPTGNTDGMGPKQFEKLLVSKAEELVKVHPEYFSVEGTLDRMIVFVDEIDKLCTSFDSSGNWNNHVQANFLTLFEQRQGPLSGITYIFAGAFSGLTGVKDNVKSSIGFFNGAPANPEQGKKITSEDLIKYGLLTELTGRISHIAQLDELQEADYIDILVNKLLPKKNKELQSFRIGLKLDLSEPEQKEIAKQAIASGQGVRFLKRRVNELSIDLEFNFETEEVQSCQTGAKL